MIQSKHTVCATCAKTPDVISKSLWKYETFTLYGGRKMGPKFELRDNILVATIRVVGSMCNPHAGRGFGQLILFVCGGRLHVVASTRLEAGENACRMVLNSILAITELTCIPTDGRPWEVSCQPRPQKNDTKHVLLNPPQKNHPNKKREAACIPIHHHRFLGGVRNP